MATAKTPIVVPKPDVPADPHGITTTMKREIARAIGRVGHKADKQGVLIETLKGFIAYAEARHKDAKVREGLMAKRRAAEQADLDAQGFNASVVVAERKARQGEQLLREADAIMEKANV